MDVERTLKWIGLSTNESKVYLSMIRKGTSKAGRLAKYAQLNRTSTYEALRGLLEKGFASYVIKDNRKWFTAVDPKRLVEYVHEKEEEAQKVLPELEKQYASPEEKHNVTLYYGYKGVKSVFLDILREAKDNCVLDSELKFTEHMPYFVPHFKRGVEKAGIKIRHIARTGVDVSPTQTTKVKYLDLKTKSPVATNIYSDKIAIIIWSTTPEAVIIKNKLATDAYREYFEELWKIAKP